MKSISLLPQELQGYLKLLAAVIITDSQHMIIDINEQYETTPNISEAFLSLF